MSYDQTPIQPTRATIISFPTIQSTMKNNIRQQHTYVGTLSILYNMYIVLHVIT